MATLCPGTEWMGVGSLGPDSYSLPVLHAKKLHVASETMLSSSNFRFCPDDLHHVLGIWIPDCPGCVTIIEIKQALVIVGQDVTKHQIE